MQLENKVVLITGGGSGIGLEIVKLLAPRNSVVSLDRRAERAAALKAAAPAAHSLLADVTNQAEVDAALDQVQQQFGRLDLLLNNAGIGGALDVQATNAADLARTAATQMAVNYVAPLYLTRQALPMLQASRGTVVFTTSGLAYTPSAADPTYSATKAALHSAVQSLRHQLRTTGVQVVELLPPTVDTNFTKGLDTPKIKPEQVAHDLVVGLEKNHLTIRVGQAAALSFLSRLTPAGAFRMLNPIK